MKSVRERLIGSWTMVDWVLLEADTKIDPPFGPVERCGGLLIYSADGMMSATLSALERPTFTDSSLDGGTDDEKSRAFETIVAYCGRFSLDENTSVVTHHVRYATLPNWVGNDMNRICIFDDDDVLKLDTPAMKVGGVDRTGYILWKKVD